MTFIIIIKVLSNQHGFLGEDNSQMSIVEDSLSKLRNEIVPYKPIIVAVTKYFGVEKLVEAYDAGLRDFAENRIQDALEKFGGLPDEIKRNSTFHLIGHLQSNKVKKAVGQFGLIQSVDSFKIARAISLEAKEQGIIQRVLLQVNNADEESKFGFSKDVLDGCFEQIIELENVQVDGIMNIAPIADDETLRFLFKDLKRFKEYLENKYNYRLRELSTGMSDDYKIALEEGSTMVRIGRKLFI